MGAQAEETAGQTAPVTVAELTPLWALKVIYFVGIGANACLFRFITVFYQQIGLDNARIGILQLCNPWVTFTGSFCWAAVCDFLGEYKTVLVVSNTAGALVVCALLAGPVHAHFAGVLACMIVGPIFLSSRAGVTDALTLQVVRDYERAEEQQKFRPEEERHPPRRLPSYGEQRLWGAAGYGFFGLLSGTATDVLGDAAMFAGFFGCLMVTVLVISTQLPSRSARRDCTAAAAPGQAARQGLSSLWRFEAVWFFANLMVYGMHMALVETYLFVYLIRDFTGASRKLLGASVAVMCTFELPVFFYIKRLIDRFSLTSMLSACHVVFALRVFAYSLLPTNMPWLVLLIEPLHGITMAAMWSCSVEFGRRLAPKGMEARMQAVVSGLYYRLASGAGSLLWGFLTKPPPQGYGLRAMYRVAAVTMLSWGLAWSAGWWLRGLSRPRAERLAGLGAALLQEGAAKPA